MGNRLGDNAAMALIELVDFNEVYNIEKSEAKKTTRRSRSRKKNFTPETATSDEDNVSDALEYVDDNAPKALGKDADGETTEDFEQNSDEIKAETVTESKKKEDD